MLVAEFYRNDAAAAAAHRRYTTFIPLLPQYTTHCHFNRRTDLYLTFAVFTHLNYIKQHSENTSSFTKFKTIFKLIYITNGSRTPKPFYDTNRKAARKGTEVSDK